MSNSLFNMLKRQSRIFPQLSPFRRLSTPKTHFQNGDLPQTPPTYFQMASQAPKPLGPQFGPVATPTIPIKKPMSFGKRVLLASPLILIVIGMMGLSGIIEKEEITPEVANAIQLGITSENDGNIDDAIGCYLEAMQLMDEEGVEHVSPIYISCGVRIAQLYEYLKQLDKSLAIYEVLKDEFIHALSNRKDYESFLTDNMLNKAIRTSLAISIRFAQLVPPERLNEGKDALLFNIVIAQNRILEIYPPFLPVINDINNRNILSLLTNDIEREFESLNELEKRVKLDQNAKDPIELPLYATDETEENKFLGLHVGGWPIFTKTLIVAKDTLATLNVESGDLSDTISNLVSNSNFIQRSFDHPAMLALTFSKLAIALQMTHQIISRDYPKESVVEIIQDSKPISVDISKPEIKDFVLTTTAVESERVFKKVLMICEEAKKNKNQHISNNEMILKVKKQLDTMFQPAFEKSEMVSSVGLGLIEMQRGEESAALGHFRRAKILAVKLKDEEYITDISKWISQLSG